MTLIAGAGAGQLIGIVTAPVITRLYSPTEYGVYSVAVSILIVSVIACLRYEFAILLPSEDRSAANLLALSLAIDILTSLVLAVVLITFGPALLTGLGARDMGPYVGLIVVAHAISGLSSSLVNWAVRTKDFRQIAANRVVQSLALFGAQLGFGLLGFGAAGLLLATVAASIASTLSLARAAWRRNSREFRSVTTAEMLRVADRYRRFPIFSSWSALLGQLGLRAPFLMFVVFYGPAIGGIYALAERLCYLPVTLIAGSVGQVFIGEGARLLPDRSPELRVLFNRTTWALVKVAVAPAAILMIVAPFVTGPLFGGAWADAGLFVSILVPMFVLAFILTSTGDVLYIVERQGWQAIREILRVSLLGGSVLVAGLAGLTPVAAMVCLSIAGCVTYLGYGAISIRAIESYRPAPARGGTAEPGDDRS